MSTTVGSANVVGVPQKMSILHHIGQIVGKILKVIGTAAGPAADQAAKIATIFLPQFAPEIALADSLVTKIARQCLVTQVVGESAAVATTGAAKLNSVVAGVGPEIDAWIASAFPGATKVSAAKKAGLVQAVYDMVNEQEVKQTAIVSPA